MTAREKKLATLLGVAGFLIVNLGLYFKVYEPLKKNARRDIGSHQLTLKNADFFIEMRDQYADEIEWLEKNLPQTAAVQEVEAGLQRFAQTEASRNGLTIERQRILPSVQDPAASYHRARVELELSGKEEALHRWLDRLQTPTEFRALTGLSLSPKRDDDTLIACKVVIEQWFLPQDPATVAPPAEAAGS
jgi:hypothetical protein